MSNDTPAEPVQIKDRASRRRAAKEAAEAPDQTNPESVPEEPPTDTADRAVGIGEVVRDYGDVLADLHKRRHIPIASGVKLLEIVLQYDVQRRNLALQEASIMRDLMPPPGAAMLSPEEVDQIQDGTHPDLQTEEE